MSSTTATAGKTNVKALVGIVAFCIFVYINNMTMGILAYIMASYSDVSTTVVQTILVTPSLVGTIYGFAFGNLNKRFSVKTLLIFAEVMLLLEGVVFLLFGGVLPIYVMIVAAGFVGFMQGSANTLLGLLLLDAVPDEGRRNSLLGVCMAAMNIGGVALVTTGGVLAVGRWNNAYYLYLFIILVIVIDIICLPNTKPEGAVAEAAGPAEAQVEAAPVEKGSMKKAWILSAHYLFYFLFLYVYGTNISEYVITTHQLGTSVEAGIASSCVTVGGIIAGVLYGFYSPILKKWTAPILMA
ncbi:MAG: MFS transporter, partial [Lachnospiraceae bacterium]|nr:MFS transporter [Lachnospiraceae bacterium]